MDAELISACVHGGGLVSGTDVPGRRATMIVEDFTLLEGRGE